VKKKTVLLTGVLVCLMLNACSTESAVNTPKNNSVQNVAAEVAQEQDTESEQAKDTASEQAAEPDTSTEMQDMETVYALGENAVLGDWGISVTDAKIVESIAANYGTFSPDSTDSKYAHLFVTVTNNGKQADNFLPTFGLGDDVTAKVLYGEGYEFSATNLLGYTNEMHDSTINPLSSKDGEIAFEIPNSVADSENELFVRFSSGNESVTFKIR
jgi:Telomeric repeat-binding factor 2.